MIYTFQKSVNVCVKSDSIGISIRINKIDHELYFYTTDFKEIKKLYKIIKVLNGGIPKRGFFYKSKEKQHPDETWFRKKFE